VSVDITNFVRLHSRITQRFLHDAHRARAAVVSMVMWNASRSFHTRLPQHNSRAATTRKLQFFEDQNACAFTDDKSVATKLEGRDACCGSSLRVDNARNAANPATLIGVIADSAPPQIIASASPR